VCDGYLHFSPFFHFALFHLSAAQVRHGAVVFSARRSASVSNMNPTGKK
jgi:hypothetical protein